MDASLPSCYWNKSRDREHVLSMARSRSISPRTNWRQETSCLRASDPRGGVGNGTKGPFKLSTGTDYAKTVAVSSARGIVPSPVSFDGFGTRPGIPVLYYQIISLSSS